MEPYTDAAGNEVHEAMAIGQELRELCAKMLIDKYHYIHLSASQQISP
jgi:hypothetical protein